MASEDKKVTSVETDVVPLLNLHVPVEKGMKFVPIRVTSVEPDSGPEGGTRAAIPIGSWK